MAYKSTLVCMTIMVALVGLASGLDLIELNNVVIDAIGLPEICVSLDVIQNAYTNEFKFESTNELWKFLTKCQILGAFMADVEDSDFGGHAKQIKQIIAEPSIKQACSVTKEQLTEDFDQLDNLSKGDTIYPPLLTRVFNLFVTLTDKVNADLVLNQVAGHLVWSKLEELTTQLMSEAPNDIEMMIGEIDELDKQFKIDVTYRKFCEISMIRPICKFISDSSSSPSVTGPLISAFVDKIKEEPTLVARHAENSSVTVDMVKKQCRKLRRQLRPIRQIKKYIEAGLISEETFEYNKGLNSGLDYYTALYEFCQLDL